MTLYLVTHRPEEEISYEFDVDYTIKGQDIYLEEIRRVYLNPSEIKKISQSQN